MDSQTDKKKVGRPALYENKSRTQVTVYFTKVQKDAIIAETERNNCKSQSQYIWRFAFRPDFIRIMDLAQSKALSQKDFAVENDPIDVPSLSGHEHDETPEKAAAADYESLLLGSLSQIRADEGGETEPTLFDDLTGDETTAVAETTTSIEDEEEDEDVINTILD